MENGGSAPSQESLFILEKSLAILQRYYDELNTSLESATTRASTALTVVAVLAGIATRVITIDELHYFDQYWPLALLLACLALLALLWGGYQFLRSLLFRSSRTPYNLEALKNQKLPDHKDPEGAYFRYPDRFLHLQIDYYYFAIQDLKKSVDVKTDLFNTGLLFSAGGLLFAFVLLMGLGFLAAVP